MSSFIDIAGEQFGKLTVVSRAPNMPGKNKPARWNCVCECGGSTIAAGFDLRSGHTVSCGCNKYEAVKAGQLANTTHGMCKTSIYKCWAAMKSRCTDPGHKWFHRYGGRGITVCGSWLDSFEAFYQDMKGDYVEGLQLDRKNNNQGYYKDNCHWASSKQNNRNRVNNVAINTPLGRMTIAEASERFNIGETTICYRMKAGWPEERLVEKPRPLRKQELYHVIKT